ncbi:N-acetylmuramoyl-L-alanine amidase [Parafrankia sp. FMc6]|uniref:peptidoglycan recognition protein family protein n=1 Tax=Parafrankia soli TaxID=2599596 RepID=UPI0034D3CC85
MTTTRYPPANFRPVRNTSGTMSAPTRGLIPHVQVGNGSLFGWFDNPRSQASSHLWLSKTGTFEQYVPFDKKAWAQADGNRFWISVECEGLDSEDYTSVQIQRLGELYAWGMREFGWPAQITDSPDGRGIGTHRMGGRPWGGHSCPGTIRADRRDKILATALNAGPSEPSRNASEDDRRAGYTTMPTLSTGDRGPAVIELQKALNSVFLNETTAGDLAPLAPDGVYGTMTTSRVASCQRFATPWFGPIDADGICGPDTWRKIGFILGGMNK